MNQFEKIIIGRTDLAKDDYDSKLNNEISDFENHEQRIKNINVIKNIVGQNASKIINKKEGIYYTIDLTDVDIHDNQTIDNIEEVFSTTLKELLEELDLYNKNALIIGLGNSNVTPDAIGPYVIDDIVVTRHLAKMNMLSEGFSSVCAMSPGVMGTTGIETYDIIEGIMNKLDIDFIIVVDALATNSIKRLNRTIQITNTGIKPGAGVGNKRKELSYETLNIPVIAIGVPTVVDATTITIDAISMILKYLYLEKNNLTSKANLLSNKLVKENLDNINNIDEQTKTTFLGSFGSLNIDEQRTLLEEVLTPQGYNLIVTPKEIDIEVEDLSKIIARGINTALHFGLYEDQIE